MDKARKMDKTTQEVNMQKLDEIDFKSMDNNATEQFKELRKDIEGLARRLSLTSGSLPGGNHIQVDGRMIEDLNASHKSEEGTSAGNQREVINAPNDEEINKILLALPSSQLEVVSNYIVQSVLYHTNRCLTCIMKKKHVSKEIDK